MSVHRRHVGLALRFGLGAAALASIAFMASSAGAGPQGYCSASSPISPTGRQNAIVSISPRDPSVCVRIKLGGTADSFLPDCWKVAATLGCFEVVDLN